MESEETTYRQAIGIGAKVGVSFMLLIAVFLYFLFYNLGLAVGMSIMFDLPVIFFGIIGGVIGRWSGETKTKLTTWNGAIVGSIFGVVGLFWVLASSGFGQ